TTYSAGAGLTLTGTTFAIDNSTVTHDWADISGIPADIADGDDDTTYSAGSGLTLTGTTFSANSNFGSQSITTTGNISGTDITATGDINVTGSVFRAAVDLHPDYVFQKYFLGNSSLKESYDFQTLAQIEAFVKKHYHLPGIKSAEEVRKDGVWDLGASNLQNLEKIEELFLHTIEQEKKIDQLKTENQSLSAELQSLRKDMEEIKALLKNKD
ncbi:bZIP transcription factor, partial [Arenibacter palladensis]